MKNKIILFSFFLLTSCATIFSKKICYVKIASDIPNSKIKIKDSVFSLPVKIALKRSKEKLSVVLFNDSISKPFILKPSLSPKFIFGNLFFINFHPIAHGVDFTNPKRFYYRKEVYLNSNTKDSIIKTNIEVNVDKFTGHFKKKYPSQKGQFNYCFNLTSLNFLKHKPENEEFQEEFTPLSLKIGLDYFYKNKAFVSTDFKILTKLIFFGENFDPYERTFINSHWLSITNNNVWNRFSIGYGLNYSKNNWKKEFIDYYPSQNTIIKTSHSLGLKGNLYYQLNSLMYVGVNYDNSFFQIYPNSKIISNQILNFEFLLKIKKKKKNIS